jgi:hypothetical protein
MIKCLNLHFLQSERQLYRKVSIIMHLIFWFWLQNITHGPYYSYLQLFELLCCFDLIMMWEVFSSAGERSVSRVAPLFFRTVSSINATSELLPTLGSQIRSMWHQQDTVPSSLLSHMVCFSSHIMFCHTNFFVMSIRLYIPAVKRMGLCWKH